MSDPHEKRETLAFETASERPPEAEIFGAILPRLSLASDLAGRKFREMVEGFKCWLIEQALYQTGGNRTDAAKLLGISRTHLMKLMRDFGISAPLARPKARQGVFAPDSDPDQHPGAVFSSGDREVLTATTSLGHIPPDCLHPDAS